MFSHFFLNFLLGEAPAQHGGTAPPLVDPASEVKEPPPPDVTQLCRDTFHKTAEYLHGELAGNHLHILCGSWSWTPKPFERTPQDTPKNLCGISKNLNLKLIIEFFHLYIIPMTLFNDFMPYFDEFIHVYG